MPSPDWDSWERQARALARRRRRLRRQRRMLWLLTVVTTVVLLVLAWLIKDMSRVPTATRAAAALSASAPASVRPAARPAAQGTRPSRPKASPSAQVSHPRVTDYSSGLSYRLLSSPWRRGCPPVLATPMFSWSAGESAVAGQVIIGGSAIDWHGNACSGQLQQQFAYSGPADLQTTATSLVGALDPAYYSGVQHYRTLQDSSPLLVSGHQAWMVRFLVNYPNGASQGLTWTSELGTVVIVDRGPNNSPAVFYVSVPSNLATSDVGTLIRSLRASP